MSVSTPVRPDRRIAGGALIPSRLRAGYGGNRPTDPVKGGGPVLVLRRVIGEELRRRRTDQGRTLREVSSAARVSLGYLSEVERGQKEASSELLASICSALGVPLSVVLRSVSDEVALAELAAGVPTLPVGAAVSAARPVADGAPAVVAAA